MTNSIFPYLLQLADSNLILAQRNAEWTGHGPVLEQDIAITNISLDLLGQARNIYQHAASLYNSYTDAEKASVDKYVPRVWKDFNRELQEDDMAFLRDEQQYLNVLITELPKGDWAFTILRQFIYSVYQHQIYQQLQHSGNEQIAAIAEKSIKEVVYHVRWSGEWVIRLGDGTDESKRRITNALSDLWMYTGELFSPAAYEKDLPIDKIKVDLSSLKDNWYNKVSTVLNDAGISLPDADKSSYQTGGKVGQHTEYLEFMLAEMQHLQRVYPNSVW